MNLKVKVNYLHAVELEEVGHEMVGITRDLAPEPVQFNIPIPRKLTNRREIETWGDRQLKALQALARDSGCTYEAEFADRVLSVALTARLRYADLDAIEIPDTLPGVH